MKLKRSPLKKYLKAFVFIILLLVLALYLFVQTLFSGGSTGKKSSELIALENAAETIELSKGREVERDEQDRELNPPLGEPKQPRVHVVYEPTENFTKEDLFNEVKEVLRENNWQKEELSSNQVDYYIAVSPSYYFTKIQVQVFKHSTLNTVGIRYIIIPR